MPCRNSNEPTHLPSLVPLVASSWPGGLEMACQRKLNLAHPPTLGVQELRLREHLAIAFVAPSVQTAVGHRILDGADRFVRVRAVWKLAQADIWTKISKEANDFLRDDVPQLKLANSRRVDDIPAHIQRNQLSCRGRVFALLSLRANRIHS